VNSPAILVEGLSKKYALYANPADRLKEMVLRRPFHHEFWALRDVSLQVPHGQTLGIVGENGSGKSTLLKVLAGVLRPTLGQVRVSGRVAALLELGAGFNPEFTARENVLLNGAIMGLSEAEMKRRFDAIAEFASVGEFIDEPVKTYSDGMYVRLAFATAINVDPDLLIVDEALAVGDAYFQHRCMLRMAELQAQGVTIVVVSHDVTAIKRLCQRALWIDHGRVADDGEPERVVARYLAAQFGQAERSEQQVVAAQLAYSEDQLARPNVDRRFGNGDAEIVGVGLFDAAARPIGTLVHGQPVELRVQVLYHRAVSKPMVGFVLRDRLGTDLASTNTTLEGDVLPPAAAGDLFTVHFTCQPPVLHPGSYSFALTAADGDLEQYMMNDWIDNALVLEITGEVPMYTLMRFPIRCRLERKSVVSA